MGNQANFEICVNFDKFGINMWTLDELDMDVNYE